MDTLTYWNGTWHEGNPAILGYDILNEPIAPYHDVSTLNPRLEPFYKEVTMAIREVDPGRVVILAAGTGNPFFTTDTCAALRAAEIQADVLLKATKVDGIYTADPKKDPEAKLLTQVTFEEVHRRQLRVMDLTAITLAMERRIPLVVGALAWREVDPGARTSGGGTTGGISLWLPPA